MVQWYRFQDDKVGEPVSEDDARTGTIAARELLYSKELNVVQPAFRAFPEHFECEIEDMAETGGIQPHRGRAILVYALLSWGTMFLLFAFCAIFMGIKDLKKMRHGLMDAAGRDLTLFAMGLAGAQFLIAVIAVGFLFRRDFLHLF